jgi:hypothetical protein
MIQNVDYGTLVSTSTTINAFAGQSFKLSDLSQVSTFSALFDQYRIDMVECWVVPQIPETGGTLQSPVDYVTAIDYDDATAPSNYTTVEEYQTVVSSPLSLSHYRKFRPHVAVAVYAGGVFTSFKTEPAGWIDMASTGVEHYGLKIATLTTSVAVVPIHLSVRLHVSFKFVR